MQFLESKDPWFFEIETNGTMWDARLTDKYYLQVNVSPKLISSGVEKERRLPAWC
jgi:hypothetical protein